MASAKHWRFQRKTLRRPTPTAQPPGTVTVDPQAKAAVIHVIAYGPDRFHEQSLTSLDDLPPLLDSAAVTWVNIDGLGSGDVLQQLASLFKLHPLAMEDVVNTHQRAKVDDYGDILFTVARMIQGPPLVSEQISLFVGPRFVLTLQEDVQGDSLEAVRERIRKDRGRIRRSGPDYLLYELLDAVIDGYFPVLEKYGEWLDGLESEAPLQRVGDAIRQLHHLRGDLLHLRRIIWPHRDMVQSLLRGGHDHIRPETEAYFRDCHDHVIQLIDILEIFRESCADLRDFYYSKLSNRTNEIMRMLTLIATLFMPLSFVAGVYGMNFEHMPETKWPWGYPLALTAMGTIATSFIVYFWRKGWLQSAEPKWTESRPPSPPGG